WTVTYCERETLALPERAGRKFFFVNDRMSLDTDIGSERYVLDESADPKRIDFVDDRSPPFLGIYAFVNGQLMICSADPGMPRPTGFVTTRSTGTIFTKLVKRSPANPTSPAAKP